MVKIPNFLRDSSPLSDDDEKGQPLSLGKRQRPLSPVFSTIFPCTKGKEVNRDTHRSTSSSPPPLLRKRNKRAIPPDSPLQVPEKELNIPSDSELEEDLPEEDYAHSSPLPMSPLSSPHSDDDEMQEAVTSPIPSPVEITSPQPSAFDL
jgi:hypothetical protein